MKERTKYPDDVSREAYIVTAQRLRKAANVLMDDATVMLRAANLCEEKIAQIDKKYKTKLRVVS